MDDCNIFEALGQVSSGEVGTIFRNFLRSGGRQLISEVMAAEVTALYGPKHHPIEETYVRSGSSTGRVLIDGQREEVIRPRVRQRTDSGSSEVQLETSRPPMILPSCRRQSFKR